MDVTELTARLRATVPDAELQAQSPPTVPELSLWLIAEDFDRGPLPNDVAAAVMGRPAYWSFCWASGQALARWILDHPERVAGRTVLDFGAGSGVAGIAAALAGAERVIACDNDEDALLACRCNAELNGVRLECLADLEAVPDCDLVLVADVLYDPVNRPLIDALLARFPDVLLADSRVRPESLTDWAQFDVVEADTIPDLDESPMYRCVRFYRPNERPDEQPNEPPQDQPHDGD